MPVDKFQCTQCGSADFTREGDHFLRCKYCHSLFKMREPKQHGGLVIGSGAHVVFGKGSHVVVKGGMSVSPSAHVSFLGDLEVIERSSQEKIDHAKITIQKEKTAQSQSEEPKANG